METLYNVVLRDSGSDENLVTQNLASLFKTVPERVGEFFPA